MQTASPNLTILFWILKHRQKAGKAPLSARITLGGERVELTTSREVPIVVWDSKAQMLSGKSSEAKDLNNYLSVFKSKILACQLNLELRQQPITAEAIKNEFLGVRPVKKLLGEAFQFKLHQLSEEIKIKKKAQATYNKYEDLYEHVQTFIKLTFKVKDKHLDEITYSFICDFEFYLSVTKKLQQNTSMKYISMFKSIMRLSQKRGWVKENSVSAFTCSFTYKEPLRLEMHELKAIYEKEFATERLSMARDIYVFMCYTGFAYIDTRQLTKENIFWGIDKQRWIAKDRQKTDGYEAVPLLDVPLQIIEKYKSHPLCLNSGKLLPVNSNQKFNEYLKEIAAICGINKELTTHSGRHTFATSVTLENDVPLETVGKMLGHRSIKSTQRYAHVTKRKISNNMNDLKAKLNDQTSVNLLPAKINQ